MPMPMTMASSVLDGSIAIAGAISVVMAFVASLRGFEAPVRTEARREVADLDITLKQVA